MNEVAGLNKEQCVAFCQRLQQSMLSAIDNGCGIRVSYKHELQEMKNDDGAVIDHMIVGWKAAIEAERR